MNADFGTHFVTLNDAIGELYPAGQALSAQVDSLVGRAGAFRDTPKEVQAAAAVDFEVALAHFASKIKEVTKMVDDRSQYRQDIMHYEEKVRPPPHPRKPPSLNHSPAPP